MAQVLITPHAIYKWFRQLSQGHTGTGTEADGFYINKSIGTNPVNNIKYFKVGTGAEIGSGGDTGELSRTWFDTNIKDQNSGKGDLAHVIDIYAVAASGYDSDATKKELFASNFYTYGNSPDSKVIGVLGVQANGDGNYWDIPGVAFQVGCHLTTGEGNFTDDIGTIGEPEINEIGLFDDDDVLIAYGTFLRQTKTATTTFKCNIVAMLKALDFELIVIDAPTTSTTSSSSTSSSTSTSVTLSTSTSSSTSTSTSTSSSSSTSTSTSSSSSTSSTTTP